MYRDTFLWNELRHGYPCKQNRLSLVCELYSWHSHEAEVRTMIHSQQKRQAENQRGFLPRQKELRRALCLQADNGSCLVCELYSWQSHEQKFERWFVANKKDRHKTCLFCWRRIRDSNSGTVLPVTRFPIVRPRPTRRILRIATQV